MTEFKKYKGSEANFQKAVASYLDFKGVLWMHCPNGGTRNEAEAVSLKKQGVKSGVPDVCILEPRGDFHGLFIELKVGYNKLSKNQENWIDKLGVRAYKTAVSYSLDETRAIIDEYLKIK